MHSGPRVGACSRPAEERIISLSEIAEKTKLPLDGVEHLLMKTLSVRKSHLGAAVWHGAGAVSHDSLSACVLLTDLGELRIR